MSGLSGETAAARSAGRRSRLVRRLGKIALAAALVLVLLALAAGLVFAGSASHIAAGVEIAGVNVGGLTAEEAQARLEATARRYESVPVAFTAGGATFPLRPSDVEARANWAAAVEEALERGDGPVPFRGPRAPVARAPRARTSSPRSRSTGPRSTTGSNQIAADVDQPAREAALVLNGLEPEVVPGQAGPEARPGGRRRGRRRHARPGSSAWRRRSRWPSTSRRSRSRRWRRLPRRRAPCSRRRSS